MADTPLDISDLDPETVHAISEEHGEAVASSIEHRGSKWPGMTYEQGVAAALAWVLGETDDRPMAD